MKYYLLRRVSDPKVLGVNNGVTQVELNENNPTTDELVDFFMSDKYWDKQRYFPEFPINATASLIKGAKLTDFLMFSPALMTCPFMISERVLAVFSKFKIQKYQLYPVKLYNRQEEIDAKYYIFCCPFLGYEYVNFKESIFYKGNDLRGREYLSFNDHEEYRNISIKNVEKIVLNSNFDTTLDLVMPRIGEIHVSEALKDAIEILGFTGVKILDIEPFVVTTP